MRLSEPRLRPLEANEWDEAAERIMQPFVERGTAYNIFRTLTHYPELMRRWLVFANHVLFKSTLPPHQRELVILRIGYLCRSEYEWAQHVDIARQAGMSDEQIRVAKTGPETPGLTALDRLLLQATDELHGDCHISDATWAGLSDHLDTKQIMDVVFAVGQYNLVSMVANTLGIQIDEGFTGWDV
jgi:alkylhydroperoxidase family enzyme